MLVASYRFSKARCLLQLACVFTLFVCVAILSCRSTAKGETGSVIWLEAEQFHKTGGWSNDCQFVDLMGSPYLLAGGLGKPVEDAVTFAQVTKGGEYRLWVRCKDWLPTHSPGRFEVRIGDKASAVTFGKAETDAWQWVDGGVFELEPGRLQIRLCDLTGWWGRCDALVLACDGFRPSDDPAALARQREKYGGVSPEIRDMGDFDVVVVGGGSAGCGAAVAAARHGCKVAFIQDRPVLGGNASSEISIPPMGYTGSPPDKVNVTGLAEEFFPRQDWRNFADSKKIESVVRAERNICVFLNTRATGVEKASEDRIKSVVALDVNAGRRMRFCAPLFIDCTGHGWVGYYAGAEYRMGQEARREFNESLAPVKPGSRTMGNNLYNSAFKTHDKPVPFESPNWAYKWTGPNDFEALNSHKRLDEVVRPANFDVPSRGQGRNPGSDRNGGVYRTWWVEYGGVLNIIEDAEKIRDELFRINIGLWNYAKNHNPKTIEANRNKELVWLTHVMGVRESRRLVGDYIMTQRDYDKQIVHQDTVAFTDWGIDVHHPEGFWVKGNDCIHVYKGKRICIPYRTLYSKNIANLLMAGRCHSATHIAMGGTRVMRPVCMMGQAAGTAAGIAAKHQTTPRGVYENHIDELQQALLKDGCYLPGVRNADKDDIALRARVTASSSGEGMAPEKVNNGWNRVVGRDKNAWAPDPEASLPQWIQLELDEPTAIDTIHATFQRTKDRAIDFTVETWLDGSWRTAATVRDNQSRRCVINFQPVETDRIRLVISKTAGQFGVCEIRLYDETHRDTNPAVYLQSEMQNAKLHAFQFTEDQ
ncbi:MAG TPA: FAD-dependent oxidoreductase [Sedimentisphaerales bacterium]|nr:FAD-dependent oxidoreductase [Sedimentisphaerales bacterium]